MERIGHLYSSSKRFEGEIEGEEDCRPSNACTAVHQDGRLVMIRGATQTVDEGHELVGRM